MTDYNDSIGYGQNEFYQSPELEVIEVLVEHGYVTSDDNDDQLPGWKPTYW